MSDGVLLDYALGQDSSDVDLRTADVTSLRYYCFAGDIIMRIGDVDLSARYGWVPVLDFAVALRSIARTLETEPHAAFEFTESPATIEFDREGDVVSVRASYATETAQVPYAELREAAEAFLARVVDDLTTAHPELADNPFVAEVAASP
jgi:hypothetical protein